jgi:hypothetical protein
MTGVAFSDTTGVVKFAAALSVAFCAILALAFALPAGAAEIVARNAKQIHLSTDTQGRAMVTYYLRGRMWHVFYSGAINARQPSQAVKQVKFKVDYSGGRGEWRRFKNTCRPYDGPKLAWFVTACKAKDGSYWALQAWQRMLPNAGYVPWKPEQKAVELHISHWTGELAQIEVYQDWIYGGKFHEVFGRATYKGAAIHGFGTTRYGAPTDRYGRLLFLDTYNSAYGPGWKRENSFVAHRPTGAFCYGFFGFDPSKGGYIAPPGYPAHQLRPPAQGQQYHLTMVGPGVTPDVAWAGDGLPNYDPNNPALVEHEQRMNAVLDSLGDRLCGRH